MKATQISAISITTTADEVQTMFREVIKEFKLPLSDFQFVMEKQFTSFILDMEDGFWNEPDIHLTADGWLGLIEELEHDTSDELLTFLMLQCVMRNKQVLDEVKKYKAITISCEPTRQVLMSYRNSQLLN